jgi:hypothetical protein
MEKTHWKKVFNSDYLGSCDLEDGADLKAIIKLVSVQPVKNTDGKDQDRNVATFTDPKIKPMVLNATNCKVVKKFAKSPYINDWVNIPVQIFVKDDIKAFGDLIDGLRLREFQPKFEKPNLTPDNTAWAKAVDYLKKGNKVEKIKETWSLTEANEKKLLELAKV